MQLISRYPYRQLEKITYPSGARHYICPESGNKLASVTTVLDATSVKTELLEWRKRVGDAKADQVKKEATGLGTLMHTHLENYIRGLPRPGGTNLVRVQAERMADQIIERGLVDVEEVWGNEICLWASQLFAGTTDVAGIYRGKPAIMDFKTAKKMRSRTMIEDYLLQMAAYALAHNELFDTKINTGVIFMVTRDYDFRAFVVEGAEFEDCQTKFLRRLEQYIDR